MDRRRYLLGTLALAGASLTSRALSQVAYPSRPIEVIDAFPAGGGTDILARIVAARLQARVGQPIVVQNKPGAGGIIGAGFVAKSAPDGYTLLLYENGMVLKPFLHKDLPYDPLKLAPIGISVVQPMAVAISNDLPVKSISDLVAHAKAQPGRLFYATPGVGSLHHLAVESFMRRTATKMERVTYKGAPDMLNDLVSGRVHVMFAGLAPMLPYMKSGKVRWIAVCERKRLEQFPEIPTVGETVPGFEAAFMFGFAAPHGTPVAITHKLSSEIRRILNSPEVAERLRTIGFEPRPTTAEQMRSIMQSDHDKWGDVIKTVGITIE